MRRKKSQQVAMVVGLAALSILACSEDTDLVAPTGKDAAEPELVTRAPVALLGDVMPPARALVVASAAHVSDVDGDPPSAPGDLLYINRAPCVPPFGDPACQLTAPDGNAITWGDWSQLGGRGSLQCVHDGTHAVLLVSGAVPGGVYTVWFNGAPLGSPNGSENEFMASAGGQAALSVMDGDPACVPGAGTLILAYHNDGLVYGPVPGPSHTWATHGRADLP